MLSTVDDERIPQKVLQNGKLRCAFIWIFIYTVIAWDAMRQLHTTQIQPMCSCEEEDYVD